MMRWIVGTSLKFRFVVVALAVAMMWFGLGQLRDDAGRRVPRVRATARGDPDALPRSVPGRGRVAGHHPARAGAQRCRGAGRHALEVGAAAVVDRAHLQARHRPDPGPPARAGAAADRRADAADVGGAARHAAAPLGDQPGDEDRPVVEDALAHRHVDDRLLDDPGPRCCACPAWPTSRSGASACRCCRCRSSPTSCARRTSPSTR